MIDHATSLADGESQSLHKIRLSQDPPSEGLKTEPDTDTVKRLTVMLHDIRGSLHSMLATLKLLNRGYYGTMDEEAAKKIKDLLSNATRLSGMAEECLGEIFAVLEGVEMGIRSK